jgi:tetratricopeptide (TPR) repeat protein
MKLRLKPSDKNTHPLGGILIKGSSVHSWLLEIQSMELSLAELSVYPLPGTTTNSVWGCLVVCPSEKGKIEIGRNTWCQVVHNLLFFPEKAAVYPAISAAEANGLFGKSQYLMHPQIGLVALAERVDWTSVIQLPEHLSYTVTSPAAKPFFPAQVRSFQVKPVATDDLLQALEKKSFPQKQEFTDKPLNPFEKLKLLLYRQLFTRKQKGEAKTEKTWLFSKLERLADMFGKSENKWSEGIKEDFEELEKRNQKHLDRLMEMFQKDPAEALKYAIPLGDGTGRGSIMSSLNMQKRWLDFSLFGGWQRGGGGAVVLPDDSYHQLMQQYNRTAEELIKKGDYTKAAFVYMKLLKNYNLAAETLEKGKLYGEAASVYLNYCHNKGKAAQCFEKGAMITNAIELYKELNNLEKVGDLYASIHNRKEALFYYQKVADSYTANHQYLKASLLYRKKMNEVETAQDILLKGWRQKRDAFNCMNNYFAGIRAIKQLGFELETVYQNEVTPVNREIFLRVLQHEYGRHPELNQQVRDLAYEIIVEQAKSNPSIVSELQTFNKEDKLLAKDTMRFKLRNRK